MKFVGEVNGNGATEIEGRLAWKDLPDSPGLWWFRWSKGGISLVKVSRDVDFVTLSGEGVVSGSKGEWSAVVEPLSL